jgi:lysyl-tRNA synthetase class 2
MKPEKRAVDLSDEEKAVFNLLKDDEIHDLATIKTESGLSNKKWDKTLKSLRNHKMIDVYKEDDNMKIRAV